MHRLVIHAQENLASIDPRVHIRILNMASNQEPSKESQKIILDSNLFSVYSHKVL